MAKGKERTILQEIHCRVDLLLKLRNRIAHHEPVIGSNREPIGSKLLHRHQEMFELLEWMDSNFAQWVRGQDRFHEVMNACPMTYGELNQFQPFSKAARITCCGT